MKTPLVFVTEIKTSVMVVNMIKAETSGRAQVLTYTL